MEPDRRRAIEIAIRRARSGDVVLIAGKGHEPTQTIGDQVLALRRPCRSPGRSARRSDDRRHDRRRGERWSLSLFGTRYLITFFRNRGKGQPILGKEDRGPDHHMPKPGTPTMGGLAIVVAAFFGWVVAHFRHGLVFSNQAVIAWVGILVLSAMGFLDDYIKINKGAQPRHLLEEEGLHHAGDLDGHRLVAGVDDQGQRDHLVHPLQLARLARAVVGVGGLRRAHHLEHGNAVNVTDGLDGLAAGSALLGFLAFTIIAYWAFRNPRSTESPPSCSRRGRGQPARPRRARRPRSPARAAGSCGSTPRRRGSSWATSARWRSAPRWRCWR